MAFVFDPQLLRDLALARQADDTPAWVRALIGAVLALLTGLQEQVVALQAQLAAAESRDQDAQEQLALLRRQLFGPKSERGARSSKPPVSPPEKKTRTPRSGPSALDQAKLDEETVQHAVPDADKVCPVCGGKDFVEMPSETSREFELALARLIRRIHARQKLACRCGCHVVTAPAPPRVTDGGVFRPVLHADTVVRRCMDAIPLHRMADMYQRSGIPLSVSTLNDLFHATATKLTPLYDALEDRLRIARVVHADETPHRVLAPGKCEIGFLWNFSGDDVVLMVHSANRSGLTPKTLLDGTFGVLVADAFSGYNVVEGPASRKRQGCMSHARRKFVDAAATDPVRTQWMLGHIALLYRVESYVREQKQVGTDGHLRIRDEISRAVLANMRAWLDEQLPVVRPKSRIGVAIAYMRNQWDRLCLYLEDPDIPIDNNEAERQLRRPVLGRKTSLFVANHDSGQRYAINYSLVMTCRKVGVDPTEYLAWVLLVIDDYPARRIEELLPHRYAETRARLEAEAAAGACA